MFKLKQFVSSGFCLKCQGCCRFSQRAGIWVPHLLKQEKERLAKKIQLKSNSKDDNFICASFNIGNNECTIYSQRPFECQLYPFLINRQDNKVFLAVDLKCPFVQEKLKSKEYKKYIQYLISQFKTPTHRDILKNNPQIIHMYREVLNLSQLRI